MTENIITVNKHGVLQLPDSVLQLYFKKVGSSTEVIRCMCAGSGKFFVIPCLHVVAYQICGQIKSPPCLRWIYMEN